MRLRHIFLLTLGLTVSGACVAQTKPKLVVVISIDQCRGDYLNRFKDFYLPARSDGKVGGFEYIKQNGANFLDARHRHVPTYTGPGHAAILTGSGPALHGIIGNDWYDRVSKKPIYCVQDSSVHTVGGSSKPMSPQNLMVTTVGDELKMATNNKAKVVGLALKDRAAILLAGHAADTVLWFDGVSGLVTSTWYSKKLPNWAASLNEQKLVDADRNKIWTPLLEDSQYALTRKPPFAANEKTPPAFAHNLGSEDRSFQRNWMTSPYGQEFIFKAAKLAIKAEELGKDEVPDMFCMNLASNDYIGHAYGPNSPEVMDITIRTDRLLSDFFNSLNKEVPGGLKNVLIVVTSDHGVMPIVEEMRDSYKIPVDRIDRNQFVKAVESGLNVRYGAGKYVESFIEPHLYLDHALIEKKGLNLVEVQEEACRAANKVSGVYIAFGTNQISKGQLPYWDWSKAVSISFNPERAGDLAVFEKPGFIFGGGDGTTHGSPWAYDAHVPLVICGPGIKKGAYTRQVGILDLAPTLSTLLGIEYPSGAEGSLLSEALSK